MTRNVLEYLEHSAAQFPDKIAVQDAEHAISYAELVQKAKSIGSFLAETAAVRNRPMMVLIDRNLESIVLFMGIVYSGNFYVPVNASLPLKRIQSIAQTLSPAAILSLEKDAALAASLNLPVQAQYETISKHAIAEDRLSQIRRTAVDTDPLYAIFTSGSTGVPKGVLIAHRGVIDLVSAFADTFSFSSEDVFGNQAPFDFDVSTKDLYNAFRVGEYTICGTRGWMYDQSCDSKLRLREAGRLQLSLSAAEQLGGQKLVFMHYPPAYGEFVCTEVLQILQQHGVQTVYYGHIHGAGHAATVPKIQTIALRLVSADTLNFCPLQITP